LKKAVEKKSKEEIIAEKKLQHIEREKMNLLGYDPLKKIYSKELTFPLKDSSIAILRISDFTKGSYKKFYKKVFQQLDSLQTKSIILDLRDNGGGRISEINTLYSYLSDSSFRLIDKSEVTSKTSLCHFGYYHDRPLWSIPILSVFLPIVGVIDTYFYLKTTKDSDHKYYYKLPSANLTHPSINRFKGRVYVLINGGSFSASCLLSANLKGSKRATFVGRETGGSFNGCVAGIMPEQTLPTSKVTVRFGLLEIKTHFMSEKDGRGILPDVEITPTLKDRINGIDTEIQWVLNDFNGLN
jgi:C-terminal processing protease CtpA/Prc